MDLLALADFHAVVAEGSFGRASRATGRAKATLSRRVMALERSLGVRLFERGAKSVRLTEAGATLRALTQGLLGEISEAAATVSSGAGRPRGRLRISASVLFAHVSMGRLAAAFVARYPEIRLEVTAEDRLVDPVEDGYDLVIRTNPRDDDRLVGRRVLDDRLLVAASPALPIPAPGREPVPVPAVVHTSAREGAVWRIPPGDLAGDLALAPDPVLRLSSLVMMHDAVRAGAGAALLPESLIAEDLAFGRLVCWGAPKDRDVTIWALHASRRLVSSNVTAFLQFLTESFPGRAP